MEYPKRIEGERIVLRKAKPDDFGDIYSRIYSDEVLLSTMFLRIAKEEEDARERLRKTIVFQADKPLFFIARKETDEVIGLAGIKEEEEAGVWSEAGIAIARDFQGQGYATEALALLLSLAFDEYHAAAFAYYFIQENEKSKALALHFGFVPDSERKETREYDRKEFTVKRYILPRLSYLAGRESGFRKP